MTLGQVPVARLWADLWGEKGQARIGRWIHVTHEERKLDPERRTFADLGLDAESTSTEGGDLTDEGEPETCTLAALLPSHRGLDVGGEESGRGDE